MLTTSNCQCGQVHDIQGIATVMCQCGNSWFREHGWRFPEKPKTADSSAARKAEPVYSGVMNYFKRTLRAMSRVSFRGNAKHNPNQPLQWSKNKSVDQPDCVARHMLTPYEIDPDSGERHIIHVAWRTCAWAELCLEAVELNLCTWEDLESGKVVVAQLGQMIVDARAK